MFAHVITHSFAIIKNKSAFVSVSHFPQFQVLMRLEADVRLLI